MINIEVIVRIGTTVYRADRFVLDKYNNRVLVDFETTPINTTSDLIIGYDFKLKYEGKK